MALKKIAPQSQGVNFGNLDMYAAAGGLPEGDYAVTFKIVMYQAVNSQGVNAGPPRLGVMTTNYSLTDPTAQPREQFYSMGSNADKSFAPDPNVDTRLKEVPGGPATTLQQLTNWAVYLRELYNCGLPEGVFTNDLEVLNGIHVHIHSMPEPEERKGFVSKTGESSMFGNDSQKKNNNILVPTEIKDNGKPWEGTGGIPDANAAPTAPTPAKTASKGPIPVNKKSPAPPPPPAEDEADLRAEALNALTDVITKFPAGLPKLKLRTETFKVAGEKGSEILNTYFSDDESLNSLLGELGYVVAGNAVKPEA